ncbi:hypothetical protein PENSPDRAFT_360734 [Peniophora sp. CONT]|nr:hypothetical protein PENSPDRAFT_360734 [Peniophora sp. CONT]
MVRGTTLGIPDGKTFGSVEPRKVEGVEEMVRASFKQEEQAIMLWDASDDKKAEALRLAKQAFENTVTTSEIWSSHPESGDPSTRYSTVVDAGGKPWLTFRWWSALGEGNPAYYFDIVERASNKVLKPPKDLQILNVWAEHMDVLPTMEQIHANASAQNFIENRKVIWVPSPIPDSADERYRAAAGSIVVVLCDYQVVGHVQVPVVVV